MRVFDVLGPVMVGPSSSHTIGPEKIATYIKEKYPNCEYKIILYGSLSATGKDTVRTR